MAKFVAKVPTSLVNLNGLTLLSNPNKVTFEDRQSDGFTAESDTDRLVVGGEDFGYFGGRPKATTGTITSLKYSTLDVETGKFVVQYTLKKADLDLHDAATFSNLAELTEEVFAKDDIMVGSDGNDILNGFKGRDELRGKGGDDTLYGESGKDRLEGGDGADRLDGGKGRDTFIFKSDPTTGVDTIVSFENGEGIELKAKTFAGLAKGDLGAEQFAFGAAATTADHRILYNPADGALRHDADGNGAGAATLVAYLPVGLANLDADSFLII
jgi:hypothetical protein